MDRRLIVVAISGLTLALTACGDDGGGGSGGSGGTTSTTSSGSGGSGGSTTCPGALDCTAYCTAIESQVNALACANDGPYDVGECIGTCEATFDYFDSVEACVCEYHGALLCPMDDASCFECGADGTWQNTADCCTTEVTELTDCSSAL